MALPWLAEVDQSVCLPFGNNCDFCALSQSETFYRILPDAEDSPAPVANVDAATVGAGASASDAAAPVDTPPAVAAVVSPVRGKRQHQYVQHCIVGHAIWQSLQFWEEAFYRYYG